MKIQLTPLLIANTTYNCKCIWFASIIATLESFRTFNVYAIMKPKNKSETGKTIPIKWVEQEVRNFVSVEGRLSIVATTETIIESHVHSSVAKPTFRIHVCSRCKLIFIENGFRTKIQNSNFFTNRVLLGCRSSVPRTLVFN